MLSLAIRGDAYKLAGSEPSSLLTRRWRKPDLNFWPLIDPTQRCLTPDAVARDIRMLVFDAHLASIRCATALSVESIHTLNGNASQLQA